jgi:hypothetical protein
MPTVPQNVVLATAMPVPTVTAARTLPTDVFFALSAGPLGGVRGNGPAAILQPVPALALADPTSVQTTARPAALASSTPDSGSDDPALALSGAWSGPLYRLLQGLLLQLGSWTLPTVVETPEDPDLSGTANSPPSPATSAADGQDAPTGGDGGGADPVTDTTFPDTEGSLQ